MHARMDTLTERCERTRAKLAALAEDAGHDPVATQSIGAAFVTSPRRHVGKFSLDVFTTLPTDVDLAGKLLSLILIAFRTRHRQAFDLALHRLKQQNLLPPNL